MYSTKARKQRKELYNAPLHKKRKWASAHLEENLLLKYNTRAVPVVKGDSVKVMRGSFRGHESKIANVNVKKGTVEIEGITMAKADGNKIAKPIHPSNILITKLNLTDKWRRAKLERGLSAETKKAIELEAKAQIKEEQEEIRRKEEEEKAKQMEEEASAKEADEEVPEEPKTDEEPKKEEAPKQEKKSENKEKTVKKTKTKEIKEGKSKKPTTAKKTPVQKKQAPKKGTSKKKGTTKKTPAKKKEENKEEKVNE